MQHRREGRKLGRERNSRKALIKTLLGSLVVHEKITTTEAKAKEIKGRIDRLVNIAKNTQQDEKRLSAIRILHKRLPKNAAEKIMQEDFLKKVGVRESGYTRIIHLGQRQSDSAKVAIIEFV